MFDAGEPQATKAGATNGPSVPTDGFTGATAVAGGQPTAVTSPENPVNAPVTPDSGTLSQAGIERGAAVPTLGAGARGEHVEAQMEALRRRDQSLALQAFEAANGGQVATPAQVQLLRELAARFDLPAWGAGDPALATGWAWVGAAVYEAVAAGSAYVAPRRIREILARWERDGLPGREVSGPVESAAPEPAYLPVRPSLSRVVAPRNDTGGRGATTRGDVEGARVDDSQELWAAVMRELARSIAADRLADLTEGVRVLTVRRDEVALSAPRRAADALRGEYRGLVARAVSAALKRTVRLMVEAHDEAEPTEAEDADDEPLAQSAGAPRGEGAARALHASRAATGAELGSAAASGAPAAPAIGLAQLWAAVIDQAARSGEVRASDVQAWLRTATLLGRSETGAYLIGAPHDIARRRLDNQLRPAIEAAFARVLGGTGWTVEVVTARDVAKHAG
jgi:hypothetical protein